MTMAMKENDVPDEVVGHPEPSKWRMTRGGGRKPPANDMVQVGWVKWDGDEFHNFCYFAPGDNDPSAYSTLCRQGWLQVYAKQPEGY